MKAYNENYLIADKWINGLVQLIVSSNFEFYISQR